MHKAEKGIESVVLSPSKHNRRSPFVLRQAQDDKLRATYLSYATVSLPRRRLGEPEEFFHCALCVVAVQTRLPQKREGREGKDETSFPSTASKPARPKRLPRP
ncbi:MAG: hypothetical protein COV67_06155 [Nitrospinae bacterium CG11_big_fil_rev_8_21_14_0_20_56_8]|nr:MAG: hypothetical protein COV67_06155 [Nitrospinae bacterium CG11_big_fil_rev_8_21_14_0_20_56_8]